MNYKEIYEEDIERGIFEFYGVSFTYKTKREDLYTALQRKEIKGEMKPLINNVYFEPEGYVISGDICMKAQVYFLRDGKISQIILHHGKKSENEDYTFQEKYHMSIQFIKALCHESEKIYFWGSIRTYLNTGHSKGDIYFTFHHKGFDPYKS